MIDFSAPWTIVLCYPDQKTAEFIPGTTESFTVEKYKEEFHQNLILRWIYFCATLVYMATAAT